LDRNLDLRPEFGRLGTYLDCENKSPIMEMEKTEEKLEQQSRELARRIFISSSYITG